MSDVDGLTAGQLKSLRKWLRDTYMAKYPQVGVLVGPFFDAQGQPTEALKAVLEAEERLTPQVSGRSA